MAVVGTKADKTVNLRGYENDEMHGLAAEYLDQIISAKQESGIDMLANPAAFFRDSAMSNEMRKAFVENSYSREDPRYARKEDLQSHIENMEALYDNDKDVILTEATNLANYSPIIGMTLPIHKNLLMNAIFDQVMPKDVARSPKFTLTMETRTLVDVKGNEIDMFAEQNLIKPAIEESIPRLDMFLNMEQTPATNPSYMGGKEISALEPFGAVGNASGVVLTADQMAHVAHTSMRSAFSKIYINGVHVEPGETYCTWVDDGDHTKGLNEVVAGTAMDNQIVGFNIHAPFTPGYGDNTRQLNKRLVLSVVEGAGQAPKLVSCTLLGYMNEHDKFLVQVTPFTYEDGTDASTTHALVALTFHAVLDVSSAAFPTVKTKWSTVTDFFEIPEAPHVTVPITPEEVKDIQALYDVNQITKLMSQMRLALLHWKDDSIRDDLNESFKTMPANAKVQGAFDFAPPLNYTGTPVTWRHEMFMDNLDMYVTRMLQVLNDENMTVAVFGRPEIIKRIAPQSFTYQTPANIGPVELDFTRTVVTSEKRVYNFISSNKLRNNNNLIILLIPRNSMRITYKVIDYQLYISNEIRDTLNYQLPSMTCFERWLFLQYQPVQGRIQIKNVSGLRENVEGTDYIGTYAMNDYTANTEQYASEVNGVIDSETGHMKIPPIQ